MKRRDDDEAVSLLRLADSINDRTPIDWDREGQETPGLASRLRRLKSIEAIATAYRGAVALEEPPTEDEAPSTPLFTWGPLRVIDRIGQGSYGEVFRAWDPTLARFVALKLWSAPASGDAFDPEAPAVRRILTEARRLARIRHPNVVTIHGADVHDGRPGLWADYLEGETLHARLEAGERLGAEEAAVVGVGLCRALAALHAARLVHGDLKAANVLRERGGRIVLLDFGSARDTRDAVAISAESLSGTPLAMSPEVLKGETPTAADDLYSLGALLFRLTTGRHPIEADSHETLLARHARGERLRLRDLRPDLPGGFVALVERALAPTRSERPASAAEFESGLWSVLRAGEGPAVTARSPRRGAGVWLAAAALLVVVGGAALFFGRGDMGRAPAVTALPAFDVAASLFRAGDTLTEQLSSGHAVSPGDRLFLEIEAVRSFHAYVLDEDQTGNLYVLYPVAGLEPGNPLAAGERHRLPGALAGTPQEWQVTSAGGRETVLIVASEEPLPLLEAKIRTLPKAAPGQPPVYAQLDAESLDELRGIAGLVAAAPATPPAPGGRLADLAANLETGRPNRAGLWIRRIDLSNP